MTTTIEDQTWTLTLPNGATVPARLIRPADAGALRRFHHRLSQRSIYLRFFEIVPDLSDERARYFTQLDGVQRVAIVALDPNDNSEIIAVARIDRGPTTNTGELALIVEDRWQGAGIGSAFTKLLLEFASRRGCRQIFAYVLPENHQMLSLLHDLGLPLHSRFDGGATRVDIDLDLLSQARCSVGTDCAGRSPYSLITRRWRPNRPDDRSASA